MVPLKNIYEIHFYSSNLFRTELFPQYDLMSDYTFTNSTITGRDIFPEIKKDIFIYRIPNKKNKIFINSNRIAEKFKQYGIKINKKGIRRVKFIRISPDICLECIGDYIAEEFQNFYPILDIEKVFIYPKNAIELFPEDYSIIFKSSNLKKSEGYFYIESDRKQKVHFKYKIKAYLMVIKSAERIKRGTIIDHENTYSQFIEFERFRHNYVTENQLGGIIAKSYIPKDRELTTRQIAKIKLIKRNQYVRGFLRDGVVYIEVEVKALQSGGVDDIIRIETPEGTKLRAKIISGKLVKIL